MPILTKGQLTTTPVGLTTTLSLEQLQTSIDENSSQISLDGGWGSLADSPEYLGQVGRRDIEVGKPRLDPRNDYLPERLKFRRYWWQLDRSAVRVLGKATEPANVLALQACDVIISPTATENQFLALFTTRDEGAIRGYAIPQLEALVETQAAHLQASFSENTLNVLDPDFFFWLMYRVHNSPKITDEITLNYLRDINGMDTSDRTASLKNGVDLDRAELLAMIMGGFTSFGPATIELTDSALQLDLCVRIFLNGGFQPILGDSAYQTIPHAAEPIGVRLVDDIAYRVLPELIHAFNSDEAWKATDRDAYVKSARKSLGVVLSGLV